MRIRERVAEGVREVTLRGGQKRGECGNGQRVREG